MATISIRFRPHWVNAALLRVCARPFVELDGNEYPQSWTASSSYDVESGAHELRVFVRYRGTKTQLGSGQLSITIVAEQSVLLDARNGWANHMPFELRPSGSSPTVRV